MTDIISYLFAGIGIGVILTLVVVWLFVFRPLEKELIKKSDDKRR